MLAQLTLRGHLGKDPETRYAPNGKEFCHFGVAVNNNKVRRVSNREKRYENNQNCR